MEASGRNSCTTYFFIRGDFDPEEVSERLGLRPDRCRRAGELRRDGKIRPFLLWEYGRCEAYHVFTGNQMLETIRDLVPRTHILRQIKQDFDVEYWLEIVPWVFCGESTPALGPPQDVLRFCCETGTNIDIDLYLGD